MAFHELPVSNQVGYGNLVLKQLVVVFHMILIRSKVLC
jgi:hypothetical protein